MLIILLLLHSLQNMWYHAHLCSYSSISENTHHQSIGKSNIFCECGTSLCFTHGRLIIIIETRTSFLSSLPLLPWKPEHHSCPLLPLVTMETRASFLRSSTQAVTIPVTIETRPIPVDCSPMEHRLYTLAVSHLLLRNKGLLPKIQGSVGYIYSTLTAWQHGIMCSLL